MIRRRSWVARGGLLAAHLVGAARAHGQERPSAPVVVVVVVGESERAPRVWLAPFRCPGALDRAAFEAALRIELGHAAVLESAPEPTEGAQRVFVEPAVCADASGAQVVTAFDPSTGAARGHRVELTGLLPASRARALALVVAEFLRGGGAGVGARSSAAGTPEPNAREAAPGAPEPRPRAAATAETPTRPMRAAPAFLEEAPPAPARPVTAALEGYGAVRGYFSQYFGAPASSRVALWGGGIDASLALGASPVWRLRLGALGVGNGVTWRLGSARYGLAVARVAVGPQVTAGRFSFEVPLRVEAGVGWARGVTNEGSLLGRSAAGGVIGLALAAAVRVRVYRSLWATAGAELGLTLVGIKVCGRFDGYCGDYASADAHPDVYGFNAAAHLGLGWNY